MRIARLAFVLALFALPSLLAAQTEPAPPETQPGATAPTAPAPPPAPAEDPDRRVILSTQPGGTAEPEASIRYKGPNVTWEGAEWEIRIPGWYPELGLPSPLSATWGLWAGGRGSIFIMPLDERLRPLTREHDLEPFEGNIYTIGPRFMFEVDKTLRVSFFFDTGSQDVERSVDGHRRTAHVNLTRLGVGFEALQPISRLVNLTPADEVPAFRFFRPGDIKIGMGMEMGGGNLNLSFRGIDPENDWTHNEPLMFMTPMVVASVPLSNWSCLDFYAGYQFVSMNEFSLQYINDDVEEVRGNDFDGWVGGVQLMFGTAAFKELRRDRNPSKP